MAPDALILDVASLRTPDAGTIATLALLQLIAKRGGLELRLAQARPALRDLIELMGFADALPLEPRRESEQGEQTLGVEEERELGDRPV
jgi:hypothetical protein